MVKKMEAEFPIGGYIFLTQYFTHSLHFTLCSCQIVLRAIFIMFSGNDVFTIRNRNKKVNT